MNRAKRKMNENRIVENRLANKNSKTFTDTSLHALDKNEEKCKKKNSTFDRKHINCMVPHMVLKTSIPSV